MNIYVCEVTGGERMCEGYGAGGSIFWDVVCRNEKAPDFHPGLVVNLEVVSIDYFFRGSSAGLT
jgi:hypothetical protein